MGRPRLVLPDGVMIAQMVKRYAKRRVVGVARRVAQGTADAVQVRLTATQGAAEAVINTAYIERLNATFRAHLTALVRRTRAAARQSATLEAGMWLVGTAYNFCWPHDSLRRHQVGRAHARAGRRAGHAPVVGPCTPPLPGTAPTPQTAGPPAPLAAGGGPCRLTTVPWGATVW